MSYARELVRFLCANGYVEARQAGSHLILKHPDPKTLAVPTHRGKDVPKGLFLRILKTPGLPRGVPRRISIWQVARELVK